jgi:hypothetical protein
MRVLASTTANDGHSGPLLSFARACRDAGHEVAVAAPASYAWALERAAFAHLPFSDAPSDLIGPVMASLPELGFDEADHVVVGEVFGRIDAQAALPGLRAAISDWRPDVVLREPAELGSLAAAEQAGVPHARVTIGMQEMDRRILELTREPMTELGELVGLPSPHLSWSMEEETVLSLVPEGLDRAGDPDYLVELPVHRFREDAPVAGADTLPSWGNPEAPLVYVTFGSVTGSLPPFVGVFREALDALADDDLRVFMTVGRRIEPEGLGPPPANAHVVQWWPQDDIMGKVSALLGHGGFGTTFGAYARGLPQVVAPIFTFDQVVNGVHIAAQGTGRTVPPGPGVVERGVAELRRVLTDPAFATRAREGARQVADLPPISKAVPILERLAA